MGPSLTFGQFQTETVIVDWGFKVIYRAVHVPTGVAVALSVVQGSGNKLAFNRNCDFLKGLQHRNLPRYVGHGEQDGYLYVATQFVEGTPLDLSIRHGRTFSPHRGVDILLQVAQALAHLHGMPFPHPGLGSDICGSTSRMAPRRDGMSFPHPGLGSDILLVDNEDTVTVFGLNSCVLMSAYTAPEQTGNTGPTCESNIYSLGIIAYEVLAGRRPFEKSGVAGLWEKMFQPPAPLRDHAPDIQESVSMLVEQMLSVSPQARPTAMEVVHRLEAERNGPTRAYS